MEAKENVALPLVDQPLLGLDPEIHLAHLRAANRAEAEPKTHTHTGQAWDGWVDSAGLGVEISQNLTDVNLRVPVMQTPFSERPPPPSLKFHSEDRPTVSPLQRKKVGSQTTPITPEVL